VGLSKDRKSLVIWLRSATSSDPYYLSFPVQEREGDLDGQSRSSRCRFTTQTFDDQVRRGQEGRRISFWTRGLLVPVQDGLLEPAGQLSNLNWFSPYVFGKETNNFETPCFFNHVTFSASMPHGPILLGDCLRFWIGHLKSPSIPLGFQ
jgi:hypothetical protein